MGYPTCCHGNSGYLDPYPVLFHGVSVSPNNSLTHSLTRSRQLVARLRRRIQHDTQYIHSVQSSHGTLAGSPPPGSASYVTHSRTRVGGCEVEVGEGGGGGVDGVDEVPDGGGANAAAGGDHPREEVAATCGGAGGVGLAAFSAARAAVVVSRAPGRGGEFKAS